MRLIEQEQPRDDSGLRSMDLLDQQAAAGPHYLVPLPKGLDETSLELFGMFTYEIRVGHTESRWSSAQGPTDRPFELPGCSIRSLRSSARRRATNTQSVFGRRTPLRSITVAMFVVDFRALRCGQCFTRASSKPMLHRGVICCSRGRGCHLGKSSWTLRPTRARYSVKASSRFWKSRIYCGDWVSLTKLRYNIGGRALHRSHSSRPTRAGSGPCAHVARLAAGARP